MSSRVIIAEHPGRGRLYAAIDPTVRFITPGVRESRFAARLAPFMDEASARIALKAAGAKLEGTR
jgi:hypothetical protein